MATTRQSPKLSLVPTSSPARLSGESGSPLRRTNDMGFSDETEYKKSFSGKPIATHNKSSNKRGNASNALWLSIGEDKYVTETATKFPGHMPPPAAARPVPVWEPNQLPFHDNTIYKSSFPGTAGSRPEIHKPKQQTETLPIPISSATEYRVSYPAYGDASPTKREEKKEWKPAPKPFFGLTQYNESFTGAGTSDSLTASLSKEGRRLEPSVRLAPGDSTVSPSLTDTAAKSSPLRDSFSRTSPAKKTTSIAGFGSRGGKSSTGEHTRVVVTTYGDLDGTGSDPWKLMKELGYDVGARGASGTGRRSSATSAVF